MSRRAIFFGFLVMLFIATMTIGMTLIYKDQTKEALEVFSGSATVAVVMLILWLVIFDE